MSDLCRHIEVELTMLPSRQCGRRAPIFSGFQGIFHCDGSDSEASPILDQIEFVFPGESTLAYIHFRTPETHVGRLRAGMVFKMSDQWRVIAHGTVRRLVDLQTTAG
jgi:hypothetical protein